MRYGLFSAPDLDLFVMEKMINSLSGGIPWETPWQFQCSTWQNTFVSSTATANQNVFVSQISTMNTFHELLWAN